jgi:lysozyme family protein
MSRYDIAFPLVISAEGGYVNDPDDPGGETKFGISHKAYPALQIANLTIEDAKLIYLVDYWNKMDCDSLPPPLDLFVFDCAVNMGRARAKEILTDTNGKPLAYQMARIGYYIDLCKRRMDLKKFFFGWVCRVIELTSKGGA